MALNGPQIPPPGRLGIHVVIIGAGIGGLACAIACRRANPPLAVTVVERAPEILTIGAGIHIPPNACRVVTHLGLLDKLKQEGAYSMGSFVLRRYKDGVPVVAKPMGDRMKREYGAEWLAIHRGDYQNVLVDEAQRSGVRILTNADMVDIETGRDDEVARVVLKDGKRIGADVIVGADGLWSQTREYVLGRPMPPMETGDLAYRGTFTRAQLTSFKDERIDQLMEKQDVSVWMGSGRHAVFYPLRNKTEFNLVLLCADDLPEGVRTSPGSVEEMAANFEGWDPVLNLIISCLKTALKWKLLHFKELDKWTKGPVALLGDASHPTLPYQGQGAAMAVEDGAILGTLLAKLQDKTSWTSSAPSSPYYRPPRPESAKATTNIRGRQQLRLRQRQRQRLQQRQALIPALLRLYESLRKKRTETNVSGAVMTRQFYHLPDGDEQMARDRELAALPDSKWQGPCRWNWGDAEYQRSLLGFDVLADAEARFEEWYAGVSGSVEDDDDNDDDDDPGTGCVL